MDRSSPLRGQPMHFRDLGYFLALARTLDAASAAREVGVARPALTAAIGRLEGETGGPLFEKSRDGWRLTPMGTELLSRAPRLILLRDEALQAVRRTGAHATTRIAPHEGPDRRTPDGSPDR